MKYSRRRFAYFVLCLAIGVMPQACSRKSSQINYYRNESARIEFRKVIEAPGVKSKSLKSSDGNQIQVSDEILIHSKDIAGVEVREGQLTIWFSPDSWNHIRDITQRNLGGRIALIKDEVVLSSAQLATPLADKASLLLMDIDLDKFLIGFVSNQPPSDIVSAENRLRFLRERVIHSPDDLDAMEELAFTYTDGATPQYAAAIPLWERLTKKQPYNRSYHMGLVKAYAGTNDFEKTFNAIENLLTVTPENEQWMTYGMKGSLYAALNKQEEAVMAFKKALFLLENKTVFPEGVEKLFPQQTPNQMKPEMFGKQKEIAKLKKKIGELEGGSASR